MELHHPGGGAEHNAGLPLVRGDHHHRGTLGAQHQVVQPQRGDQRGLPLPSRQHPTGERGRRVRVKHRTDQLDLPWAQTQRL